MDHHRTFAIALFVFAAAGFAWAGWVFYGPGIAFIAGVLVVLAGLESLGYIEWPGRKHDPTDDDHQ